ncbi:hypothetical protein FRC17_005235 [Serendipita sp. 399]|nr:hypothetical protein FRC17_005235 [Serendipita sp. 399]
MVSADNLPFDVLPLVFRNLSCATDLLSIALASKAFNGAAIPLIYNSIIVNVAVVKKLAKKAQSPFQTLINRPALHRFPQSISISAVPLDRGHISEQFYITLAIIVPKLVNLSSFTFNAQAFLPALLPGLANLLRITEISVLADTLDCEQAKLLLQIGQKSPYSQQARGLRRISIHSPSPSVLDTLPEWIERNGPSIESLSVKDSALVTSSFVRPLLDHARNLTHLSLTRCPNLDHWSLMKQLEAVPRLSKLQLGIFTYSPFSGLPHHLNSLKHLSLYFMISKPVESAHKIKMIFSGNVDHTSSFTL